MIVPRQSGLTVAALSAVACLAIFGAGQANDGTTSTKSKLPPILTNDGSIGRPLPINLPTALQLADANAINIAVTMQRVQAASSRLQRDRALWLPTVYLGADYFRHDGQIQDIVGNVFTTSRSAFMVGVGPSAVFAVSDAIFAPLASRQIVRARKADVEATRNNTVLSVAESYFSIQQARGDVASTADTLRRATDLLARVEKLAPAMIPTLEINRVRTELARRRQAVESAYERWQSASAELVRQLRLDAAAVVEPAESPEFHFAIIDIAKSPDDLIPVALTSRPELAANQALVQATLVRLRQEKIRPLVPSVLIRGNATNPAGTLAGGYFGGGVNDNLSNFGARNSMDFQLVWELQNLGLGNRAAVKERASENRQAVLELFRTQDQVAAEVVQALAQAQRSSNRLKAAEEGLQSAVETFEKSLQGLGQAKRAGEVFVLIVRPQEVVAALSALDQAYRDYYAAVADNNRAQFRLYRAIGYPGEAVLATCN